MRFSPQENQGAFRFPGMMFRLKASGGAPLRRPASWILRRLAGRRRATFQEERSRVFGHSPKIVAAMEAPTRYFPETEMHPENHACAAGERSYDLRLKPCSLRVHLTIEAEPA